MDDSGGARHTGAVAAGAQLYLRTNHKSGSSLLIVPRACSVSHSSGLKYFFRSSHFVSTSVERSRNLQFPAFCSSLQWIEITAARYLLSAVCRRVQDTKATTAHPATVRCLFLRWQINYKAVYLYIYVCVKCWTTNQWLPRCVKCHTLFANLIQQKLPETIFNSIRI